MKRDSHYDIVHSRTTKQKQCAGYPGHEDCKRKIPHVGNRVRCDECRHANEIARKKTYDRARPKRDRIGEPHQAKAPQPAGAGQAVI